MNKYIENDYKRNIAEKVIIGKLLDSGAEETNNGTIVKSGFLNTKIKGNFDMGFDYCFSFTDAAENSYGVLIEDVEKTDENIVYSQVKIGYEIVFTFTVPIQFFIKIHTPTETFKTLGIDIPEEILLSENPWKEFTNFVDNKLNIVESNIKFGQNNNINELLK